MFRISHEKKSISYPGIHYIGNGVLFVLIERNKLLPKTGLMIFMVSLNTYVQLECVKVWFLHFPFKTSSRIYAQKLIKEKKFKE